MDVNTITNSRNSMDKFNNLNISQVNVTNDDDEKVSSIPKGEERQEDKSSSFNSDTDEKKLNKAINKLNKFLEDDKTHAEYSVHKELGKLMIKIVDDDTKKTILELPPEKILDMVASMCKQVGLLDRKA